jgi:hypothetical protein
MSSEIEWKARVGRANFSNRRVISGVAVAITNHTTEMRPRCLKLSFRLLKRAGNTMGTNAEAVIRRASTWTNATVISKL